MFKVGDKVLCVKSPERTDLIMKGEVYTITEVERYEWTDRDHVRIIDRRGMDDTNIRFDPSMWFVPALKLSNKERMKKRMEELCLK